MENKSPRISLYSSEGSFTFARNQVLRIRQKLRSARPALRQVGRRLNTYMGYVADGLYIDEADIASNPTSTLGNITIARGDIKYMEPARCPMVTMTGR